MSGNTNEYRDPDGSEATETSVGDVGTEQWQHVDPELIESGQTGRSSLAHVEETWLRVVGFGINSFSSGSSRTIILNVIDEHLNSAIVR